jgi:hypothetical protein
MPDKPEVIRVAEFPVDTELVIPMQKGFERHENIGSVALIIKTQCEDGSAFIDCTSTPEGTVKGPLVRFLGSLSSAKALDDLEHLESGLIVPGYKLVVASFDTKQPVSFTGVVSQTRATSHRTLRNRGRPRTRD